MNWPRFLAALACLLLAGCATPNVNPSAPRARTGYVDFYTSSNEDLSWEIKRLSEPAGKMEKVFSEFQPIPGNILRLAVPLGRHEFQVWFINRVTEGPKRLQVAVADGQITPVHVTLTSTNSASVDSQQYEYRPTAKATRRVTRLSSGQSQVYQIGANATAPQPYQQKEQMPYFAR
jgi:hypothetical protein